jgi:hypothetical protein
MSYTDAAILVDALLLMAAHRPNFTLRIGPEKRNNRGRARQLYRLAGVGGYACCCDQDAKHAIGRQILYTGFSRPDRRLRESFMAETVVKLRLNQQQLELMDRTITQGVAPDRVSLVRLALREYADARKADAAMEAAR